MFVRVFFCVAGAKWAPAWAWREGALLWTSSVVGDAEPSSVSLPRRNPRADWLQASRSLLLKWVRDGGGLGDPSPGGQTPSQARRSAPHPTCTCVGPAF